MKRPGRVLGNLLAMVLTVFSLHAMAETQTVGRSFDHTTTGFPLLGGHATAACETCHVAGVFKGTPRACDGCHAWGKRIVATPKSNSHIVTDAPCESCHFNTFTFLGARYNHGTAIPGQCLTCHNSRIATGKPADHNVGLKATDSCDHCHRTYAFTPASWNHIGVIPGTCENAGCHVAGSGNRFTRATATLPLGKTHMSFLLTGVGGRSCDVCHNFVVWTPAMHMPVTGPCTSCHNNSSAQGQPAGHIATADDCGQCHFTVQGSWLPALGGKPANHIPYNAGVNCSNCHIGLARVAVSTLHIFSNSNTCAVCHISPTSYAGNNQSTKNSHSGSSGSNCTNCHHSAGSYSGWGT